MVDSERQPAPPDDTPPELDPLRAIPLWIVSSFHTVSFIVLLALFAHRGGSLSLLTSSGTLPGTAAFLWLFASTHWTMWRFFKPLVDGSPAERTVGRVLTIGVGAGGANGAVFLLGPIVLLLGYGALQGNLFDSPTPTSALELASSFSIFPLAVIVAYVVGAVIGLGYALVEIILFRVAVFTLKRMRV